MPRTLQFIPEIRILKHKGNDPMPCPECGTKLVVLLQYKGNQIPCAYCGKTEWHKVEKPVWKGNIVSYIEIEWVNFSVNNYLEEEA